MRHQRVEIVNHTPALLKIPGNVSTLIILLSFFVVRYCRGAVFALRPELRLVPVVMAVDLVIAGFFTGFLIGRIAFYVKKLQPRQIP